MAGDIDFLPLDIIFHILLWLPVSSLLRFKSVCKSWLSLLESSDFVDKHTHFASLSDGEQQIKLIILRSQQQISLFSVDNKSEVSLDFPPIDDPYHLNSAKLVASCNGIICLQQGRRVCLWNPATKQYTNLPPLPMLSCPIVSSIGFGYDSRANDFKLVTINFINGCYPIHIYSLRSDSWRAFEGFVIPDMLHESGMKAPYRDRIYCWFRDDAVYTFDFTDEVFGDIPCPTSIYPSTLFILMDNIACIGGVKNEDDVNVQSGCYEIWMLNEYEVKDSWTKLYSIERFCKSFQWMTWFSKNGDFLLFLGDEQLCLYDLLTHRVMNLPVHTRGYCEVLMYRETLFSIKRGNETANGVTSDCNRRMLINQSITGNNSWGDFDVHKDAIYHILLWLPVVSLQRFKSVCKSWHSLIKSSDFVTQHLFLHHHQHKLDNLNLVLHSTNIVYYPLFADPSHHSPNTSGTCLLSAGKLELLDLPVSWCWGYGGLYIATSFNGTICLVHSDCDDVFLWNPVTKQFRVLPGWLSNDVGTKSHIGFGFDVKTNDYKLVRFCGGVDSVVQVYSLSTDSWRIIHDEILPSAKNIYSGLDAPYRDEIYCWLAEIDDTMCILSFDFSNEVFGIVVALPNSINASSLTHVLTVSRDKIVCISLGEEYHSDDMENWHCEIWMMNEYGVKESWVKLYTVGPFLKDWCFKMYYSKKKNNNGDYILLLKDGQLHEYDLVMRDSERLPYQIEGPKHYQVVAYEESLVPIKSGYC